MTLKIKAHINKILPVGRRSIIFGVHQFVWHPLTVLIAWIKLYGMPSWKEIICIIIHDWGYWKCNDMDTKEGRAHPEVAYRIANMLLGHEYGELCRYHSRHYAQSKGVKPSLLCYADKLSILYEPWWLYLPRAWLSGELFEYRIKAAETDQVSLSSTHREWFKWIKNYYRNYIIDNKNFFSRGYRTIKTGETNY